MADKYLGLGLTLAVVFISLLVVSVVLPGKLEKSQPDWSPFADYYEPETRKLTLMYEGKVTETSNLPSDASGEDVKVLVVDTEGDEEELTVEGKIKPFEKLEFEIPEDAQLVYVLYRDQVVKRLRLI